MEGIGQPRLAVEDAAGHSAGGRRQARRENAAGDGAAVVHLAPEGAVVDGAVVLDSVVERTVFDHAVVLDRVLERAILDGAHGRIVDLAVEGAAQNAAVVEHFAVELAARDGRRFAHKDVAIHRRTISDGAEIEQPAGLVAARQKQHVAIGRVIGDVLPAVALARGFAAVGILRITLLHDEVGAGDRSVQHHALFWHGEFHGILVAAVLAAVAVARADGLAVQAVDLGAGGDYYFLVHGQFGHDDVGVPLRRHTVDFRDLGIGGGLIHGDGVDTSSLYFYVAVEHAAEYVAAVAVVHPAREGAAKDRSVAAVFHNTLEDAVHDGAAVCHFFLKAAVLYGAFVCHAARKGAVLDGVAVCHFSIEGAVLDVAAVCHFFIEGAVVHDGAVACHSAREDAVLYGAFVCHFSRKDAAGNFHTPLNLNRTRHRLCPRSITVLGMGETEIIRSTLQSQFAFRVRRVFFTVRPSFALAAGSAVVGADRVAARHDEFAGAEHHVRVRHGKGHGLLVDAVVAVAVAIADGLAVQAEDLGVGGDDYFIRRGIFGHDDVGVPIRRHTVDFLDLGTGGHGDGVETCYVG